MTSFNKKKMRDSIEKKKKRPNNIIDAIYPTLVTISLKGVSPFILIIIIY